MYIYCIYIIVSYVIRSRNSKKNRQFGGQEKKDKQRSTKYNTED